MSLCVIKSVGRYLPSTVMSNHDLSQTLDTSDAWITKRTGILSRHIASPEETTATLGTKAAEKALKNAGIKPSDIHLIIVATSTPDHTFPATAALVQHALGAYNAIAFDINVACCGFLFALVMGDSFLKTAQKRYALIIGSETMSRIVDWTDRSTAILFGDGAGAVVLESNCNHENRGILAHHLVSESQHKEQLYVNGGTSLTQKAGHIIMEGRVVFKEAIEKMAQSGMYILQENSVSVDQLDAIIAHQANQRILMAVAEKIHLPLEKMIYTGMYDANTSAASIPISLSHAYEQGKVREGNLVLLQAFGAGFSWGSCLVRL